MSKPKKAKEEPSTIALRERQVEDLAKLDEEQNLRIKQMLVQQRGGRFFRGSPAMRAEPADRAAVRGPVTPATPWAGGRPTGSVPAFRAPTRASAY